MKERSSALARPGAVAFPARAERSRAVISRRLLVYLDRSVRPHLGDPDPLAGRIELDLDVHTLPLPKAVVPLGFREAVIAQGRLAVVDGHLLVGEQLLRAGGKEADLGPRRPLVAGTADGPYPHPVLPRQVVAV